MKQLIILVDMDDTIEYLTEAWVAYLNEKHGTDVDWRDIKEWDITKKYPSLTPDEVFHPLFEEEFWKTVHPMEDAVEYLHKLSDEGHKIFVVTSSHYKTLMPKLKHVLFRYFPFLTWRNVIVTTCKQMISGDVLIDDAPFNLEDGEYRKILMNAPHNESYDAERNGMTRVYHWSDIYRLICDLASE